jgi:hypothetical protein
VASGNVAASPSTLQKGALQQSLKPSIAMVGTSLDTTSTSTTKSGIFSRGFEREAPRRQRLARIARAAVRISSGVAGWVAPVGSVVKSSLEMFVAP